MTSPMINPQRLPSPEEIESALRSADDMRARRAKAHEDWARERNRQQTSRNIALTVGALALIIVTVLVARWLGLPAVHP